MLEEEDLRLRMRGKFFIFCSSPVEDSMTADIVVDVGNGEPSFWIWVTEEMVPSMVHELLIMRAMSSSMKIKW